MNDVRRMRGNGFRVRLDSGKVALAIDPVANGLQALTHDLHHVHALLDNSGGMVVRRRWQTGRRDRQEAKADGCGSHQITFRRMNIIPLVGSLP
jgi:hypothetical protein